MRTLIACLLLSAACGGTSSSSSSSGSGGTLSVSGSGTITVASGAVTASVSGSVALTDHRAPSTLTFSISGAGRIVTAEANAVVAALHGEVLDQLTGAELTVNEVLTGSGQSSGSVSPQNLPFAYVVQTFDPTASPFLVIDASASAAGTSVYATVNFESE